MLQGSERIEQLKNQVYALGYRKMLQSTVLCCT